MIYCKNCGTAIPDGQTQCPNCSTAAEAPKTNTTQPDVSQAINNVSKDIQNTAKNIMATCSDHTAEYEPIEIETGRGMSILSYFGPLCFVPIFKGMTPYTKFHANQGLLVFITYVVGLIIGTVLYKLTYRIVIIRTIASIIKWLLQALPVILEIMGIVNAANNQAKELPIIGKIRLLK